MRELEFRVKRMLTIAILVESDRGYGRGVLSGAARYVQSHGHLSIVHQDWTLEEGLPAWLMNRRCDGIIAYIETPEILRALQRMNVPLVNVCGTHRWPGIPVVGMSIRRTSGRIGYEAAALLDAMMGKPPGFNVSTDKFNLVETEPKGVVMRRSSDVLPVKDPIVSAAIRFIRQRADKAIRIEDVLDHLAADDIIISRSTLNRRFIEFLGHSTNTYIMQDRIERAKRLLTDTDYPLASVAGMIGIEHPEYFTVMFKRMTGKTPAAYRQMFGKP